MIEKMRKIGLIMYHFHYRKVTK